MVGEVCAAKKGAATAASAAMVVAVTPGPRREVDMDLVHLVVIGVATVVIATHADDDVRGDLTVVGRRHRVLTMKEKCRGGR